MMALRPASIGHAQAARRLVIAFLQSTDCKAVPLDGSAFPSLLVERRGARKLFEFVEGVGTARDRIVDGVEVYGVGFFDEVREILEAAGWRRSLRDDVPKDGTLCGRAA